MAKDLSKTKWHGIARQDIPWYPTVDAKECIGCELCYLSCGREVYEISAVDGGRRKAQVERPYNCMVGCSTCAVVCPTQAISFPSKDIVLRLEREHKIFKTVRAEAKEKRTKIAALAARQKEEEQIASTSSRVRVRIAGEFGEKRFLLKLQDMIEGRPYDIANLKLYVPTLKGLRENAIAYMDLEVVSTEQEDVTTFLNELRTVVTENGFTWVDQEPVRLTTEPGEGRSRAAAG